VSPTAQPPLPPAVHTAHCRAQSPEDCDGTCITANDHPTPPIALIGIDVDGVLVPQTFGDDAPAGFTGYHYQGPNSIGEPIEGTLWLNPEHGRWLAELVDHGGQLVWATTWRDRASQVIAPRLGLPATIPFIDVGPSTGVAFGYSVKHYPVSTYAGNRPLAWVDDHFGGRDFNWAEDRSIEGIPTLLLQTNPSKGLQREHIDSMIIWLEAQQLDTSGDKHPIDPWLTVRAISDETMKERLKPACANLLDPELLHHFIAQSIAYRSMSCVNLVIQLVLAAAAYARHLADTNNDDLAFVYLREALRAIPRIIMLLISEVEVRDNALRVAVWSLAQIAEEAPR